jgi:lipid-A-disaccharide synthase-like uncharacterized protein
MSVLKLGWIPVAVLILSVYAWVSADWNASASITGHNGEPVVLQSDPTLATLQPVQRVTVRIDGIGRAELMRSADGRQWYVFNDHTGQAQRLSPDQFSSHVFNANHSRGWLYTLLNISNLWGLAWVSLGLAGQVAFTGRMIVQWIASEKEKRSVVPVAFWWMSLIGATMLMIYFAWRRDIVGILGQGTGWYIYLRNLVLIYTHRKTSTQAAAVPEEPHTLADD